MKLLISGIHGFVGSNLVTAFRKQHIIYGLDIVSTQKSAIKTFAWDEFDRIPEVDAIIHLAGKAHDTRATSSEQDYFEINVSLTQKIFQHFINSSATKFIFFSSIKAVSDNMSGEQLCEDEIPNPQTAYGKSKLEAEKYINSQALPSIKKAFILRPCMIHGPGNKGNLNLLYQYVQKGIPWPLGSFENKRSFCSIDNVSNIVQQIIEKDIDPGTYQIADDESLSTNELIHLIASSQNKSVKIWRIPVKWINVIARIGDFLYLPLNSERLKKLTESYLVSNVKIKNALSISQMPISAQEGMKNTLHSFKNK